MDIWTATGGANQNWTLYNYSTRQFEAESLLVLTTSGDTHRLVADVNMSATQGTMFDSNAVNDYVAYVVPNVAAGSYDVRVRVKKYTSRGIVQLSVGRVDTYATTHSNVGAAQDMYSSTAIYPEIDLGTWTAGTTSDKEFRFIVTGQKRRELRIHDLTRLHQVDPAVTRPAPSPAGSRLRRPGSGRLPQAL